MILALAGCFWISDTAHRARTAEGRAGGADSNPFLWDGGGDSGGAESDSGKGSGETGDSSETAAATVLSEWTSCDSEWKGQFVLDVDAWRVDVELRISAHAQEFHELRLAGMDEAGAIYIYEVKLAIGGEYVRDESTAYACDEDIVAMFRARDRDGAVIACSTPLQSEWFELADCP